MRNRKETAWRKNRKFGDIHGGRTSPKMTDNIFRRAHSFHAPGPDQELPILIEDNPSRDYYFPLNAEECREALQELPKRHHRGITHLWLRRPSGVDRKKGLPFAEFICGSGVRLIVLYPWPKERWICLGRYRIPGKLAKEYARFGAPPFRENGWWYVVFDEENLRRFFVYVLYHEVGHHVDWYRRHWTAANLKQTEEAADQYAVRFTKTGTYVLNRLNKRVDS